MTKLSPATDDFSSDFSRVPGGDAGPESLCANLLSILDSVDLPLVVVGPDLTVTGFNRAAMAAVHLAASDIGRFARDLQGLAGVKDLEVLCLQVMADQTSCRRDIRDADRSFILRIAPYTGSGHKTVGVVLTFTNVTAFRASIDQAIYEREYTKAILNTVIGPLVVLSADLRVQTANRAFYGMFGVSRDQAHDVPFQDLGNDEWRSSGLWAALQATASIDDPFQTLEIELDLPLLGRRTVLIDARKLSRDGAKAILVALQDITERKVAEEALKIADRRKDEFLATLAHELRGPLAPLRNVLEVMKRAGNDGGVIKQACATMERQVSQMTLLVDDLLDLGRITHDRIQLKRERLELASVVYNAVEASRPFVDCAGHELSIALPSEQIYLDADPVRLTQVLGNLLNNACKYTESGGKIWLSAERQGSDLVIRVKDTGVGIPTNMLSHIFEMFAQVGLPLERSQGGLGIGLTLVKRLVKLHGGSVEAFSEGAGRGSEFMVRLPALADTHRVPQHAEPTADAQAARARRILVVDDNRDGASTFAALLKLAGNETCVVHDGLEAVEAAERYRPDVVFLDIGLPTLNGYDACRRIRAGSLNEDLVVVAMTGWGRDEDRNKSNEAGFDVHMVKPVNFDAVLSLLASLPETPGRSEAAGQSSL
jgi:signal transduction histidine kinase/ActR/RegA family two-component response regulator